MLAGGLALVMDWVGAGIKKHYPCIITRRPSLQECFPAPGGFRGVPGPNEVNSTIPPASAGSAPGSPPS